MKKTMLEEAWAEYEKAMDALGPIADRVTDLESWLGLNPELPTAHWKPEKGESQEQHRARLAQWKEEMHEKIAEFQRGVAYLRQCRRDLESVGVVFNNHVTTTRDKTLFSPDEVEKMRDEARRRDRERYASKRREQGFTPRNYCGYSESDTKGDGAKS